MTPERIDVRMSWREMAQAVVPDRLAAMQLMLASIDVTLFPNKYVKGDDEPGERVPLDFLLEAWNHDAHYVQYTHCGDRRLRKISPHKGLVFLVMIIDLDAHGCAATDEDFWHAVFGSDLLDYPPNLIVRTKSGMHWVYFIAAITDPLEFEAKRLRLIEHVKPIENTTPYKCDLTPDWTRMFRAPRVVREDGTDLREALVWGCHDRILDLGAWEVRAASEGPAKRPATAGCAASPGALCSPKKAPGAIKAALRYAATFPGAVSGEGGHNTTFRLACSLIKNFRLSEGETYEVLMRWNVTCDPPWTESELRHKAQDAAGAVNREEQL